MTTPIQPVPDLVLASEFPSLADRPAGTYNAKAKAWADSENAMVTRARETALVTHNNALVAQECAQLASNSASEAASSAAVALTALNSPATQATSETSVVIGTGTKTLTLDQIGKSFAVGQYVQLVDVEQTGNWMVGAITAYEPSTGLMSVNVVQINGSGVVAHWAITPTSPPTQDSMKRKVITGNYAVSAGDNNSLIDFEGDADAVLSFADPASLGDGWHCVVRNRSDFALSMGQEDTGPEQFDNPDFDSDWVGPNLVVNGDFNTNQDWTNTGGWSISAGSAAATAANGVLQSNATPLVVGQWYLVTLKVLSCASGSVCVNLGNSVGTHIAAATTFTEVLQCTDTTTLSIGSGSTAFTGTIDEIIVRPFVDLSPVVSSSVSAIVMSSGWSQPAGGSGGNWTQSGAGISISGGISRIFQKSQSFAPNTDHVLRITYNISSGSMSVSINDGSSVVLPTGSGTMTVVLRAGSTTASQLRVTTSTVSTTGTVSYMALESRSALPTVADGVLNYSSLNVFSKAIASSPTEIWEISLSLSSLGSGVSLDVKAGGDTIRTITRTGLHKFRHSNLTDFSLALSSTGSGEIDRISLKKITPTSSYPDSDQVLNVWRMYSSEARLLHCDGTTIRSVVLSPFYKQFFESDILVRPPGYHRFEGLLIDGGQGGAVGQSYSPASGYSSAKGGAGGKGGQGGEVLQWIGLPQFMGENLQVRVGARGLGGTQTRAAQMGGKSSVSGGGTTIALAAATTPGLGGNGANSDYTYGAWGPAGVGSNGTINSDVLMTPSGAGGGGGTGQNTSAKAGGIGFASNLGGKAGDGGNGGISGAAATAGTDATCPGGGGGGGGGAGPTGGPGNGGHGADGLVILWGVA